MENAFNGRASKVPETMAYLNNQQVVRVLHGVLVLWVVLVDMLNRHGNDLKLSQLHFGRRLVGLC